MRIGIDANVRLVTGNGDCASTAYEEDRNRTDKVSCSEAESVAGKGAHPTS